jgi:beta-phosphoglucomutase-like phosphatase (HAD superfamily)
MERQRKILYFDMDGVLVDFESGIRRLPPGIASEYEGRLDEVPGIFGLMDPMPGAIGAVERLAKVYDDYTRYRKDYAISGEVLGYKEFRKQLQHSDLFVAANQQKRMGEKNQKVWVLRLDTMGQRCDVSGFMNDEIKPLV